MSAGNVIRLKSAQNSVVEISEEAVKFSPLLQAGKEITTKFDRDQLLFVKRFLEKHAYNPQTVKVSTPVLSDELDENVDALSYDVLKDLEEDQVRDLLEVAEELELQQLKEVLIAALGCMFIVTDRAKYIAKFKQLHNIDWDLSPDEEDEIIAENEAVFFQLYDMAANNNNNNSNNKQNGEEEAQEEEECKD